MEFIFWWQTQWSFNYINYTQYSINYLYSIVCLFCLPNMNISNLIPHILCNSLALHKSLIVTRQHYERKIIKQEFIWANFYKQFPAIFDVKNFLLKWILCLNLPPFFVKFITYMSKESLRTCLPRILQANILNKYHSRHFPWTQWV